MNSKNYNKNNRKFIQGLRSFKDILPSKVKNLIKKVKYILKHWIIGDILLAMIYLISVSQNPLEMKTNLGLVV